MDRYQKRRKEYQSKPSVKRKREALKNLQISESVSKLEVRDFGTGMAFKKFNLKNRKQKVKRRNQQQYAKRVDKLGIVVVLTVTILSI